MPGGAEASREILSNGSWVAVDAALGALECCTTGETWTEADGVISAKTTLRRISTSPWVGSIAVMPR